MNCDRIAGSLKQYGGILREHWGRFNRDELEIITGKRMQDAGKRQERYGISREEAQLALAEFEYRQRDWSTRR
jgi:uncharacterized protein YjbJ (UPF0337 family)